MLGHRSPGRRSDGQTSDVPTGQSTLFPERLDEYLGVDGWPIFTALGAIAGLTGALPHGSALKVKSSTASPDDSLPRSTWTS
jgi:hypothetical protein